MTTKLGPIQIKRKSGNESFHRRGKKLPFTLLDFWQWSSSDLISNTNRGIVAEYLVANDLGLTTDIRTQWRPYDLITENGTKIEVKASAYLQGWFQEDFSKISFSVAPSLAWDRGTNKYARDKKRQADVYIFCLLAHKEPDSLNPLDVEQWKFFVLSTNCLDKEIQNQKKISLDGLKRLKAVEVDYGEISGAVKQVLEGK